MNDNGIQITVREIQQRRAPEQPKFFRELIDTTNFKCYGTQEVPPADLSPTRVIGAYGRETRTFTRTFEVERGPKLVSVRASAARPVICWEHVYAYT